MNVKTNDSTRCAYALEDLYHVDDPEIGLNIVMRWTTNCSVS
jgi:metal-sulfur cluster biosynthetic enzyme